MLKTGVELHFYFKRVPLFFSMKNVISWPLR